MISAAKCRKLFANTTTFERMQQNTQQKSKAKKKRDKYQRYLSKIEKGKAPAKAKPDIGKKKKKNKKKVSKKKKSDYTSTYLDQSLWTETIRPRVITRDENKCRICGSTKNLQVHHRSYAKKVMRGEDDTQLITLCRDHHVEIHFSVYYKEDDPRNKKRTMAETEKKLMDLL